MRTNTWILVLLAAFAVGCGGAGGSSTTALGGSGSTGGNLSGGSTGTSPIDGSTGGSTTGGTTGSTTGGTTSSGTSGSADPGVTIVATDDSSRAGSDMSAFSSINVVVHEIDLTGDAGNVVVFSDPVGVSIDLAKLQDASGPLFGFLTHAAVPAGTYTGVRIVLDDTFTATLSSTGSTVQLHFAPEYTDGNGHAILTYALNPPLVVTGAEDVIAIDFRTGAWSNNGGEITPLLGSGSSTGVDDPGRWIPVQMVGMIRNLNPGVAFDINHGSKTTLHVILSPGTTVSGTRKNSVYTLANGQHVFLGAVWNETERVLESRTIRVTGH